MDVQQLIKLLNQAYGASGCLLPVLARSEAHQGPMKDAVAAELNLHATEELAHALLLSNRILQLGGTPITSPQDGRKQVPAIRRAEDPYVAVLLDQNIAGEQCAISTYKALMDATKDKDMSRTTWR